MEGLGVGVIVSILVQSPLYLVWLAGLVYSLLQLGKHPKAAVLALVGIVIVMLNGLLSSVVSLWLPQSLMESGSSVEGMTTVLTAVGIGRSLLGALGWALVIVAIYRGRSVEGEASAP